MNKILFGTLVLFAFLLTRITAAQTLNIPNTFEAGAPARASEVNQNFDAVASVVNDSIVDVEALLERVDLLEARVAELESLQARVTQLEAAQFVIESHETRLAQVESNTVLKLDGYLDLVTEPTPITAQFAGVNVQVINGAGDTHRTNGLGNVIIGYNPDGWAHSAFDHHNEVCSLGSFENQNDCENNGYVWSSEHHSGSHNLIVGDSHRYSQYGGVIAGFRHTANNKYTSVIGGGLNSATGEYAVAIGGGDQFSSGSHYGNIASGNFSVVIGGFSNTASGGGSSVSGGGQNTASGGGSSVSGGRLNTATGQSSTVSGGAENTADVDDSHVP